MQGGLVHKAQERATIMIKTSTHYYFEDLLLTKSEYDLILRILDWLRNTNHGRLELILDIRKDNMSNKLYKSVDILPTQRDRIDLSK